jgi:hypothetical protein
MREVGIEPNSPNAWYRYCQLARGRNRAREMRKLGIDPDAPDAERQYLAEKARIKREQDDAADRAYHALVDPLYDEERELRRSLWDDLEAIDLTSPPVAFLRKFRNWLEAVDRIRQTDVQEYSQRRLALEWQRDVFYMTIGAAVAGIWMSEFRRADAPSC